MKSLFTKINTASLKRIFKFGLVGFSGTFINMFFLWFFTDVLQIYYLVAGAAAIELAIINNFFWNNIWTFADRKSDTSDSWFVRAAKYHLSVSAGAVINLFLLWLLHSIIGINYLIANAIGICIGFLLNFSISNKWVFK